MKFRPKILYLVGGLAVGGTERHLAQVLPGLKRRGWELSVLRLGNDGPMSAPLITAGIEVIPVAARAWTSIPKLRGLTALLSQARACAAYVRRTRPDIVHAYLGLPTIVGGTAHFLTGRADLVVSKRNQMVRPDSFFAEGILEKFVLRRATAVLAHSTAVRDELIAAGVAPARIFLVHNGIDVARFTLAAAQRNAIRLRLGWGGEIILLMLANLIPYKGHAEAIAALARLRRGNAAPDWRVVFVGTGDPTYEKSLRELAASLGVAGRVDFLGQRNDTIDLLVAADIGLLASFHEGFSNALLEYMAAGLCPVATAVGGNLDAVEDRVHGLLVPAADVGALAAALQYVLDNPTERATMARAARARVEREFSLEACLDNYEAVYRGLADVPRAVT